MPQVPPVSLEVVRGGSLNFTYLFAADGVVQSLSGRQISIAFAETEDGQNITLRGSTSDGRITIVAGQDGDEAQIAFSALDVAALRTDIRYWGCLKNYASETDVLRVRYRLTVLPGF